MFRYYALGTMYRHVYSLVNVRSTSHVLSLTAVAVGASALACSHDINRGNRQGPGGQISYPLSFFRDLIRFAPIFPCVALPCRDSRSDIATHALHPYDVFLVANAGNRAISDVCPNQVPDGVAARSDAVVRGRAVHAPGLQGTVREGSFR